MSKLDPRVAAVTDRIIERSKPTRKRYLDLMTQEAETGTLVDWRVLEEPAVAAAFRGALPAWARWADDLPGGPH